MRTGIDSILPCEQQFVTEQDFRQFTGANAAALHNTDFFNYTGVQQAVTDELGLKTPLTTAGAQAT
jgi:hypothetical protein